MHRNIFFSGFPIRSQAVTLRGKNLQCRSFTYQGLLRGIEICLGSLVFDENTENFYDIWAWSRIVANPLSWSPLHVDAESRLNSRKERHFPWEQAGFFRFQSI